MTAQDVLSLYRELAAQFSETEPGKGIESVFPGTSHQPMTYGLVLSAESAVYAATGNPASRRRARSCVEWLSSNDDLDGDGLPGWGLPHASDAFSDGSVNPPNHPYCITTAIVMNGLADALSAPGLLDEREAAASRKLLKRTALHWCGNGWSTFRSGGYFWYSPAPVDRHFTHNAVAMMTGVLAKLANPGFHLFGTSERKLVMDKADQAAWAILNTAKLHGEYPYWPYAIYYDPKLKPKPNDLLHHSYIIWGLEMYRMNGGLYSPAWTEEANIGSLTSFVGGSALFEYPAFERIQGRKQVLARLWGSGMALVTQAQFGDSRLASRYLELIVSQHGPIPQLQAFPSAPRLGFYPRHAAHLLWGISCLYNRLRSE